jgi:GntR family transcriptional regulator
VPLHLQIRESLQGRIARGGWQPGSRLPSEPELAEQFNVSRMTVRQAVDKLVERGLLYRRRGVGTFVAPVRMARDLGRLTSFSEDAAARGVAARSHVLSAGVEPAPAPVAEELRLEPGQPVVRVERVRRYETTPVALQTVWVPEHLCRHLVDPEVSEGSIYAHLEQAHHFRMGWGVQSISARTPTGDERATLDMPAHAALLVVRRTTFLDDGVPIELSESLYRSDEHGYTITLRR